MPQAKLHGFARDWSYLSQIPLVPSWLDVCSLSPTPSLDALLNLPSHELFDEYTRRQFVSKAPDRNPFGTEETPARFADFDVFTKVCGGLSYDNLVPLMMLTRCNVCRFAYYSK